MATEPTTTPVVVTYQFQVEDDEWKEWKDTVPRSKSLDTRLRELIKADAEGRVLDPAHEPEDTTERYDHVDDVVPESGVVERVSSEWSDDAGRLAARRDAAEAALDLIRDRGTLSKSTALDELHDSHAVDGQSPETWWRQNVRPVLREVATYSPGEAAYLLDE